MIFKVYIYLYIYTLTYTYYITEGPYISFLLYSLSLISLLAMEVTHQQQPLSIESFSYSWLVNLKPSLEGLETSIRASMDAYEESNSSFIEMDPTMPPSKRFLRNSQDFKFDFPISQSPLALVHADELFANGYVLATAAEPEQDSKPDISSVSSSSNILNPNGPVRKLTTCSSLRKYRKMSKRLFDKYLNFLVRPLYRKIHGRRSTNSRNDLHHHQNLADSRVHGVDNWVYSTQTSPRVSVAYSADDWRKSCDSETSIYEAVLHCKRSFGKSM